MRVCARLSARLITTTWISPVSMPGRRWGGSVAKRGGTTTSATSSAPNWAMIAPDAPTLTVTSPAMWPCAACQSFQETVAQLASRPPST